MLPHILIYAFSFLGIWIGSGLIIGSVGRVSKTLKVSLFITSFLILGAFTSMSEMSVGINSIILGDPEIFIGNLIGASIVIFMLIIPLLAIVGKNISITSEFRGFNLPASLITVALPVILSMDGKVGKTDAYLALSLFGFLIIAIQSKKSVIDKIKNMSSASGVKVGRELLRIIFGLAVIFIASKFVVDQTEYFSNLFNLSPFVISLLIVGVGTNIPELSFVIRSVFIKNNQAAFGDYIGSASFNTFLFGVLTLVNGNTVVLTNSYLVSLLFLIAGLFTFYYFAKTKNTISRFEGMVLLILYILFVLVEVYIHR